MRTMVRRSSTFVFVPALVVVQVFILLQRGTPWRGEWDWTVDWAGGATVLTAPLLAGCAAFELLRWRSEPTWSLLRSTPRGPFVGWIVGGAVLLIGATVHVVVTVAALVATVAAGAGAGLDALPALLMPLLVLAVGVAAGVGVATLWPSLLAVPLAAALVFGLTAFAGELPIPLVRSASDVLTVGGSTGSLVGLTWDSGQQAAAATVLVGIIVLLAALVHARDSARVRPGAQVAVVLSAALLVGAAAVAEKAPTSRLVPSSGPIRYVCAGDATTSVCLASETSRQLPWLAREVVEQSEPLVSIGVSLPKRHQQLVPYRQLPRGVAPVVLQPDSVNARRGDASSVADQIVMPALCSADTAEVAPPQQVFAARAAIAAWVRVQNGLAEPADYDGEIYRKWLAVPQADQRPWIVTTFAQLRACQYDDVRLPDGVQLPEAGVLR